MAIFDEKGREILDQTPVALPLHFDRPEPIHMRIRRMILQELHGSEEPYDPAEENDFDVEENESFEDTLSPAEQYYLDVTRPIPEPSEPASVPVVDDSIPSKTETIVVPEP